MMAYLELVFRGRSKILRTRKAAKSWFTTLSYFYKNRLVGKNSVRGMSCSATLFMTESVTQQQLTMPSFLSRSQSFISHCYADAFLLISCLMSRPP